MAQAILLHGAKQLLTLRGPNGVRRGSGLHDLGIIEDGSVLVQDGKIAAIGKSRRLENLKEARQALELPVHGRVVMPGFIDPNLALSLDTPHDPDKRKKVSEFYDDSLALLRSCLQNGTLTADIKATARASEFHPDVSLFRKLKAIGHNPVRMMRTWRLNLEPGSAEMPLRDFNQTFATLARRGLIDSIEMNAGDDIPLPSEVIACAHDMELNIKLRWDGRTQQSLANALLRTQPNTVSVNSLSPAESEVLAAHQLIAVFSTGADVFEGNRATSARALIDAGGAIALSSGYESSSAASFSMQMSIALGVVRLGLKPEEAFVAATINAAHAAGCAHVTGSLEVGKNADLLVLDASDYREVPRQFGINHVIIAMRDGNVVLNRSRWRAVGT